VSLRLRIAAAAGASVAVVVLVAAATTYLFVRSHLSGELDSQLRARAAAVVPHHDYDDDNDNDSGPGGPGGHAGVPPGDEDDRVLGREHPVPSNVSPVPFGGASGFVQVVQPSGAVFVPGGQGSAPSLVPTSTDRQIAATGAGSRVTDREIRGTHVRVLTEGVPGGGAVMVALPLTSLDNQLRELVITLALIAGAGVLLAALLGLLVARTALAPVERFTRRTEALSGHIDLSARIEGEGRRDELGRLAHSFNDTLDALERALDAQRQLVADASHELRTPIAALRANIQLLAEAERLPEPDQRALRVDIVDELDELTALVADVVELARGSEPDGAREDVRLDEIVSIAVQKARRRGDVQFELDIEPTIVKGSPERIGRAVTNVIDNARKWSPAGGTVTVAVHDGTLVVRDHGPGFQEEDLPHVFDRFYRAPGARRMPGSGLGLAIVRQAAESCGGSARAANAPGGGACLTIGFGLAEKPAPLEHSSSSGQTMA